MARAERIVLANTPFPSARVLAEYLRAQAPASEFDLAPDKLSATPEAYSLALAAYLRDTGKEVPAEQPALPAVSLPHPVEQLYEQLPTGTVAALRKYGVLRLSDIPTSEDELIRIPGIGVVGAIRILQVVQELQNPPPPTPRHRDAMRDA